MAKEIKLTKGYTTIVDDEDYEWLNKWKWFFGRTSGGYAIRSRSSETGQGGHNKGNGVTPVEKVLMHRLIMKCPEGYDVDHIDGNRLNNQKKNLRLCTRSQNNMNRKKRDNCSSKFKGVYFDKSRNKWASDIKINEKRVRLGRFNSEIEAAKAYNEKAVELFGEFARINVIDKPGETIGVA